MATPIKAMARTSPRRLTGLARSRRSTCPAQWLALTGRSAPVGSAGATAAAWVALIRRGRGGRQEAGDSPLRWRGARRGDSPPPVEEDTEGVGKRRKRPSEPSPAPET